MQQSAILSQRLAGLRSVEQTGSSTSRFKFNPFNESFQSSAGSGLGNIFNPQTWYKPCWVAAEVFGGWNKLKTRFARAYVMLQAPKWFRDFYIQHGQKLAAFIHDKPALKAIIRPLFEYFAIKGGYSGR